MKLRGLRSINIVCLTLFLISVVLTLIIIFITSIIYTIIVYNNFVRTYSFSDVPFWKDNRTSHEQTLLPILKIDVVNLSNATIVIASCCRNVKKHLLGFQRNVRAIAALFGSYRIYFCESDSDDGTLEFLNEWQKNDSDHVRVHTKGQQRWRLFTRTDRIASCRNTLLQQAREESSSFDYYFVIDVDVGSSSSFEVKDFLSNFLYPPSSWIAMTATQRAEYYDIWALRISPILPFDCWQRIKELTSFFISRSFLTDRLVKIHQKPIPRDHPIIEVQSAFGGAALYAAKYLNKECLYNGHSNHRWWWWRYEQCEHVTFHQCIQRYAKERKIYINPKFQIC